MNVIVGPPLVRQPPAPQDGGVRCRRGSEHACPAPTAGPPARAPDVGGAPLGTSGEHETWARPYVDPAGGYAIPVSAYPETAGAYAEPTAGYGDPAAQAQPATHPQPAG